MQDTPFAASKPYNLDWIVVDPQVLAGKPVIRGTRIPVTVILNLLEHGYDFARILDAYPDLTEEDIRAAIHYSRARVAREDAYLADPSV